ncbi:unnamed protein product [Heterobilharzia americana]|nr:unnamed protein product [Heterobilharzia americana]
MMSSKCIDIDVIMLDSTTRCFHLLPRALGHELYTTVVEYLQLVEYDYFDLEYTNKDGLQCWLDHAKAINKQINISKRFLYSFVVKFYTPHPNLLEDELTRYLFALQIKNDLRSGRLQCSESTAALLAAFIVQAKVGDFLEDIYQDHSYLIGLHLLSQPSEDMLMKITECHRNLIGQSPAEADYNLLDTARKVELYGIRLNPAKDNVGFSVNLAVTHSGICVYQGSVRTNMFSWARIRKLSFKRKNFFIKVHPEGCDAIGFSFGTRNECKSFWKQCIEHHAFFRCQAVRNVGRKSRVVSKGSSFRYMGRTQKQLTDFIRENYIKMPNFERSSSTGRVLNTESSAMILSSLKSQENTVKNNHDVQGNATVHSDLGPSMRCEGGDIVFRNRPQTDPSHRLHFANNLLSAESSRSVAISIPLSGQSNSVGSVGSHQIIPENLHSLKQRRSGSATGQVIIASMNTHAAQMLSAIGTASSGTYTMNSSVSAGTPTGSASPTGSPNLEDKPTAPITSSDYSTHLVWPNKLNLRPLSVSNLALPRPASAPQSGWRASLPRHIMPNTSSILIAQPNVASAVAVIDADSHQSMHASLLLTSKTPCGPNQTNTSQVNSNIQSNICGTTTNIVMASNPLLSSNLTSVRAICMPVQHQSVQLARITSDGNKSVHSQIKLPPGCAILTGSGQTSNFGGRIIYVDQTTGQSYIPVFTNASGDVNQAALDGNAPLAIKQAQFSNIASTSTISTQQQHPQSNCTQNNQDEISQSNQHGTPEINNVPSSTHPVPPDVTRNARTVGRRIGPPPPAPESKHHLDEAYHLVRELVMTERTYKRNLGVICTHFRDITNDPLCSDISISPQLSQDLTSHLVDLLSPIYAEHCVMLNNFENRLSNWSSQNGHNKESNGLESLTLNSKTVNSSTGHRIGDLFVASLHILPLYHCYLIHAANIMLDIERLIRNRPEIEKLLKNFEAQKYCYLPFYVFLLKPMHRLLQYRVLLERLMRYYGEIHPDLSDCRIAHAKLNDLIQSQWESYKKVENTYKLLEIQRDLIGFNPDVISSSDLSQYSNLQSEKSRDHHSNKQISNNTSVCGSHSLGPVYHPNRQFIREGWLQKLSKKGYQPRMFFLLSDQLVYASRTTAPYLQFKVHGQFSLQDLMVEEVEPAHSFTIYSGNRCFLVAASSDWQRDRWLEDISRAILAAKTRPSTFINESVMNNVGNNNNNKNDETSTKILNCGTMESDSAQMLQRAVTSVHVCWHRCFTLSMQDILRANEFQTSGYLLRKFKNSNGWQRLWVVFTQLCLFFYKSYRDECPLASLPLLGYTISKPGPDDQIRRDNVLKMQFKNHVYFFRGETRHSFERWVEYLSCAAGASRPLNTPVTK